MAIPVLLVTGFLGAGKTTLINHLLTEPQGRRLAAVVNDFGAINIDVELLAGSSGDVASLKNGCICCSLQGELLDTLSRITRRNPIPDGIVIETSGVSDPAEIVRALLDPVIWSGAALDTVVCVADARGLIDQPDLIEDPLCLSQLRAADFVICNKANLVTPAELAAVRERLTGLKPSHLVWDSHDGRVETELLFAAGPHAHDARAGSASGAAKKFRSMSWSSHSPISMPCFKQLIEQLSGWILRAKGFVRFVEQPDAQLLFQLVGKRATMARAPSRAPSDPSQLVFIVRDEGLGEGVLHAALARCVDRG